MGKPAISASAMTGRVMRPRRLVRLFSSLSLFGQTGSRLGVHASMLRKKNKGMGRDWVHL